MSMISFPVRPRNVAVPNNVFVNTDAENTNIMILISLKLSFSEVPIINGNSNKGSLILISVKPVLKSFVYIRPIICKKKMNEKIKIVLSSFRILSFRLKSPSNIQRKTRAICDILSNALEWGIEPTNIISNAK